MPWGVAAAAVGAAGSIVSSNSQSRAARDAADAAAFTPTTISTAGARAGFYAPNNELVLTGSPRQNRLAEEFYLGARDQYTEADSLRAFGENVRTGVSSSRIAELQQGVDNSLLNGQVYNASRTAATRFDQLGVQQSLLGSLGSAQALNADGGGGRIEDFAFNVGADLLQNRRDLQSFNGLASERLTALRDAARPSEERAVDSRINSLFSSGRLGTTGGHRALGELALQQEIADQNRIVNAQDFANSQQNQQRQFFQQQQQTGQALFGTALSAAGQDANVALQQGQLGANFLGQQGSSISGALNANITGRDDVITRAGARIDSAQNLFNFGQTTEQAGIDRALQGLGALQTTELGIQDAANLSLSAGAAGASAGANAAQYLSGAGNSGVGAALQGLGAAFGSTSGQNALSSLFSGNRNNAAIGGPGVQNNIIGGIGSAGDQFVNNLYGGGT